MTLENLLWKYASASGRVVTNFRGSDMGNVIPFPHGRRAVVSLAAMPNDLTPSFWPVEDLGPHGVTAAALMVDRVDLLPSAVADPAVAWGTLPEPMRAVVRKRNPDMASFCARWAGEKL